MTPVQDKWVYLHEIEQWVRKWLREGLDPYLVARRTRHSFGVSAWATEQGVEVEGIGIITNESKKETS